MRQRIVHGAEIDAATPSEIGEIVARAFELQFIDEYERQRGAIALDGSGNGKAVLAVSAQYDWLLERVTFTGANALFTIYENEVAGSGLLEVAQLGTAGLYSDSFSNRLYVTANSQIIIVCTGGPANGQATYNLQIKLKRHRRYR